MPIEQMNDAGRPLDENDINELERRLGRSLPAQYVAFLLKHNGGRPVPAGFEGPHPEDADSVHFFYRVDGRSPTNLVDEAEFFHGEHDLDPDLLPIARTPQGNLVCIAIGSRKRGEVFFWSHDMPDRSQSTWKLADDLDTFLTGFHE